MFDPKGTYLINAMHDLTVKVFKHMEITSKFEPGLIIKYTDFILLVSYLKI